MKLIYQVSDLITLNDRYKLDLSEKRIRHMAGASDYAHKLCIEHNMQNSEKLINMCLFHDIARDMPFDKSKEIALRGKWKILDIEFENPVLLHSPAGAQLLIENKIFDDRDKKYTDAIRKHTLWDNAETFELSFLRLCDISEYNRDFDGVESIREMAFKDLITAFTVSEDFRKGLKKIYG